MDCIFPVCGSLPWSWQGRPRRMAAAEILIWRDWQAANPGAYDRCWYDAIIPRDHTRPPAMRERCCDPETNCDRMWEAHTSLRADVIGESAAGYQIIELRSRPTEDNYGRLLRYDWISRQVWHYLRWLPPLMLCRVPPPVPLAGGEWDRITTITVS